MESSSFYLSEDIIKEILLRLPVQSLLRFRTVCKKWLALVTRSDFAVTHLQHHPTDAIMLTSSLWCTEYGISSLRRGGSNRLEEYRNIPLSSMIKEKTIFSAFVVGSSDGLLCVYVRYIDSAIDYFLWNPATRKNRQLPSPVAVVYCPSAFGFGFHPGANDYKLLLVEEYLLSDQDLLKVEVFTLSTDSWKQVKGVRTRGCCLSRQRSVIVGGMWYHLCFRTENDKKVPSILSFDMGDDGFSWTEVGLPYDDVLDLCLDLMVYKESLAMCVYNKEDSTFKLEIWAMMQNECWPKLFTCSCSLPRTTTMSPLGIWNDKEITFSVFNEVTRYNHLEFYDLLTHQVNMLPINKDCKYHEAYNYVESLISVYGSTTGHDDQVGENDGRIRVKVGGLQEDHDYSSIKNKKLRTSI